MKPTRWNYLILSAKILKIANSLNAFQKIPNQAKQLGKLRLDEINISVNGKTQISLSHGLTLAS